MKSKDKEKKGRGIVDLDEIEGQKQLAKLSGIFLFLVGAIFSLFFVDSHKSLGIALFFFATSIILLNRKSYWDWKWNYIKDKEEMEECLK